MGIALQLAHEFDEGVRSRGQVYFVENRVDLAVSSTDDAVIGKVRGTVKYRVKLRLKGSRLISSCSCPFFGEEGSPCKHIWATMLAADAHGFFSGARQRNIQLVTDIQGRDGIAKPHISQPYREPTTSGPIETTAHSAPYRPQEPEGHGIDPDTILQRHWDGLESTAPPPVPHRPESYQYAPPRPQADYRFPQKRYDQPPPRGRSQQQPPAGFYPQQMPPGQGRGPQRSPSPYGGYPPSAPPRGGPGQYPGQSRPPQRQGQRYVPAPQQVVREMTAPWENREVFIERIVPRAPERPPVQAQQPPKSTDYPAPEQPWAPKDSGPQNYQGGNANFSPQRRQRPPAPGSIQGRAPATFGPGPGTRLPNTRELNHRAAGPANGRRSPFLPGLGPQSLTSRRAPDQSTKARAAANAAHAAMTRSQSEPKRPGLYFIIDAAPMLANGHVVIELGRRRRRLDTPPNAPGAANPDRGIISTWKPSHVAYVDFLKLAAPEDLELLDLLAAAAEPPSSANIDKDVDLRARRAAQATKRMIPRGHVQHRFTLQPETTAGVVERLVRSGRCRIRRSETATEAPPILRWDDGEAWKFGLEIKSDPSGKRWTWRGALRRNDQKMDLAEPLAILPGLVFSGIGKLARFDDCGVLNWVRKMRSDKEIQISDIEQDEMLAKILESSKLSIDQLTDSTSWSELTQRPTPCLLLRTPRQSWGHDRLVGEMYFDYGGTRVPLSQSGAMTVESQKLRIIHRDQEAEADATRLLWELGFRPNSDIIADPGSLELPPKKLNQVTKDLVTFGWYVEAEGKRYRPASEFNLAVSTHIDWFELGGAISFGGQMVPLPSLLKAANKGDSTITLPDGSVGVLPEDWLRKYGFLTGLGKSDGDVLRFTKNQAALLDSMLATQPEITFDDGFSTVRKSLDSFQGIKPIDPTTMFKGELRPYQKEGLGWLNYLEEFEFGGVLADDMGLGKTVQVLAQLARWRDTGKRTGPSLIVVPRSLVFNWVQEAARFAPDLRVLDYTGPNRQLLVSKFRKYDLIVTTYGTLRSDIVELSKVEFDYVILDEAQAIKNSDSLAAKAARILKGKHRLAMSGTPIENHLGELWSLFEFINPGMLGSAALFKRTATAASGADPIARQALAKSLRPFILRRTKKQVVQDLPEKTEQVLYCDLEPEQRAYYDQLREHYRHALLKNEASAISGGKFTTNKIEVLDALLRLRQAACHPGLIDTDKRIESSAKLDVLMPHLEEVIDEGHKVLVFSQFTSFLSIVKERLDQAKIPYEYLDGRTRDREARVESFQSNPKIPVFLISLKAGGLGLNLTAAEYVYLLDPWWNPAVEAQAIDRSHRIGQTQNVFAYRLIARDTVEQKIVDLQAHKRDLAEAILGGDNRVIQSLTREDLEYLLS